MKKKTGLDSCTKIRIHVSKGLKRVQPLQIKPKSPTGIVLTNPSRAEQQLLDESSGHGFWFAFWACLKLKPAENGNFVNLFEATTLT